ncbi:uncharacterized protein LOC142163372 [Nicotiana tabacum]|uniref:Uncharacterized protein LOC142163372 n=1 Tax=Nicotiana tabacum TaxID=4097 RepID=A0AC58RVR3_TOBAC
MIAGLKLAKSLEPKVIEDMYDSLLVVNKVNRAYKVKEDRMRRYLDKLQVTLHQFKEWILQHVLRDENNEADALAYLGSSVDYGESYSGEVVQLMNSVIEEGHTEVNSTSLTWDWRNKYIDYLQKGKLPSDHKKSRAIRAKSARFSLVGGKLYRRSFFGPLARCLGPGETEYVIREVHEGTCENHLGTESFV